MALDLNACLRCGAQLTTIGEEKFRVGGTAGRWKLLLGEMAETGEELLSLTLLACKQCRKVELRVPEGT